MREKEKVRLMGPCCRWHCLHDTFIDWSYLHTFEHKSLQNSTFIIIYHHFLRITYPNNYHSKCDIIFKSFKKEEEEEEEEKEKEKEKKKSRRWKAKNVFNSIHHVLDLLSKLKKKKAYKSIHLISCSTCRKIN